MESSYSRFFAVVQVGKLRRIVLMGLEKVTLSQKLSYALYSGFTLLVLIGCLSVKMGPFLQCNYNLVLLF